MADEATRRTTAAAAAREGRKARNRPRPDVAGPLPTAPAGAAGSPTKTILGAFSTLGHAPRRSRVEASSSSSSRHAAHVARWARISASSDGSPSS